MPPRVIYNGIPPVSAAVRSPRAGSRLRLLFAGRLEPQKGADLLPEILNRVQPPAGKTCELVVHGSGSGAPLLHTLADHAPRGWTVTVHPPIARLRQHLGEFDLVLVPSRFEGQGLIAVEALQAGVPIVATDALGLRECIPPDYPWRARAGQAAAFAAIVQRALEHIATNPGLAEPIRRFANERFSLHGMLNRYRELYAQALRPHG